MEVALACFWNIIILWTWKDDIFKYILLNENVWNPAKISLKFFFPEGQINNIPALVKIMAWCRPGDKLLSEQMMFSLLTHICVNRPHWVEAIGAGNRSLTPHGIETGDKTECSDSLQVHRYSLIALTVLIDSMWLWGLWIWQARCVPNDMTHQSSQTYSSSWFEIYELQIICHEKVDHKGTIWDKSAMFNDYIVAWH